MGYVAKTTDTQGRGPFLFSSASTSTTGISSASVRTLREAQGSVKETGKGPAVVIARHPCLLFAKAEKKPYSKALDLSSGCNGCGMCAKLFDCPGLVFDKALGRVERDEGLCVNCGMCLFVCPQKKGGGAFGNDKRVDAGSM
jgi:TPP-dependent indolepyruvate ferredoxin oxidoreductase alpha subunit